MTRILFQGDSITDAGRDRNNDINPGTGYPAFVKGRLGVDYPGVYDVINRAVSGDRVVDVYARIKRDIINLKPDVLSILIGINDVWHEIGGHNGVDADKYFMVYDLLAQGRRTSHQRGPRAEHPPLGKGAGAVIGFQRPGLCRT